MASILCHASVRKTTVHVGRSRMNAVKAVTALPSQQVRRALTYDRPRRVPRSFNNYYYYGLRTTCFLRTNYVLCISYYILHTTYYYYSRCPPCSSENGLGLESGARSDRFCYDPRRVIVVGQKRHQTRFWPEDASVDGGCNARSMTDVRTDDRPLRLCQNEV